MKQVTIIDQLYDNLHFTLYGKNQHFANLPNQDAIIHRNSQKITSNLLGMNIKRFFLRKNIFICLYSDILNQNLSISKIAIYHPPCSSWPTKKVYISELSGQIFTNLPRMCEKKICANKMNRKWQNYLKQKNLTNSEKFYKAERRGEKTCHLAS